MAVTQDQISEYAARRAAEQAQEKRDAAALFTLGRDVAKSLGTGWKAEKTEYGRSVKLHGPNGERFDIDRMWRNSEAGRLEIDGVMPQGMHDHKPYDAKLPRFTVAASRGADPIAKGIVRVLAEYRAILNAAKAIAEARNDAKTARAALAKRICDLVPGSYTGHNDDSYVSLGGVSGSAKIMHNADQINLDISVSAETALAMLAVLADRK